VVWPPEIGRSDLTIVGIASIKIINDKYALKSLPPRQRIMHTFACSFGLIHKQMKFCPSSERANLQMRGDHDKI
jgi:hypothetical protein